MRKHKILYVKQTECVYKRVFARSSPTTPLPKTSLAYAADDSGEFERYVTFLAQRRKVT